MSIFTIHTHNPNGSIVLMQYDNQTSALTDMTGQQIVSRLGVTDQPLASSVYGEIPLGKISPKVLKISLGLSCNYECGYCSQRFVPRASETNLGDINAFISSLGSWVTLPPEKVEFWGGEPLVYIKTLRPLAEAIRAKYPNARFSIITNGSLLNSEINGWLDALGFSVGISHDGPGQYVRGPDPLQNPEKRAAILDLYCRLAPKGRISFNAVVNRSNFSRAAIQQFFVELTGDPNVPIGEGAFVDAYDAGGISHSIKEDEMHSYRRIAFHEIRTGQCANVSSVCQKTASFVNSIRTGRLAKSLGQKCSMDQIDKIAVDLRGNILTCQNVSAASVAANGESHRVGHVSNLAGVRLNTSTHWGKRKECPSCPMLQICQGSCMFLNGLLWERSCDNAYSDAIPIFAAGIEFLTGCIPVYIDGNFRADRKDVFGQMNNTSLDLKKRVIQIKSII